MNRNTLQNKSPKTQKPESTGWRYYDIYKRNNMLCALKCIQSLRGETEHQFLMDHKTTH